MSNLSNDNYIVWRFICRTFLFALLPALLFLTAYEIAYRNIPNSYSLKKEYLDRSADSIDILILGSSHAFYGVNPEYFSLKAFNAANVSQSFDYDARIYNAYFKGEPYPDYLILSVSAFSFWERLESTDEHWRSRKYSIYMGFGSWRDWFSPDGYEFQLGDRTVLGYYVLGKDFVGCSDAGTAALQHRRHEPPHARHAQERRPAVGEHGHGEGSLGVDQQQRLPRAHLRAEHARIIPRQRGEHLARSPGQNIGGRCRRACLAAGGV